MQQKQYPTYASSLSYSARYLYTLVLIDIMTKDGSKLCFIKSLMAQGTRGASQGHEMFCHDPGTKVSNPHWVEPGRGCSPSV